MNIPSCYNDNDNIDDDNNWVSVVSSVDSSISVKLKPRAIFKNYILLLARSLGKKMAKYNGSKFSTSKLTFTEKKKKKKKKKTSFYYVYRFSKKMRPTHNIHINRLSLFIFYEIFVILANLFFDFWFCFVLVFSFSIFSTFFWFEYGQIKKKSKTKTKEKNKQTNFTIFVNFSKFIFCSVFLFRYLALFWFE